MKITGYVCSQTVCSSTTVAYGPFLPYSFLISSIIPHSGMGVSLNIQQGGGVSPNINPVS